MVSVNLQKNFPFTSINVTLYIRSSKLRRRQDRNVIWWKEEENLERRQICQGQ